MAVIEPENIQIDVDAPVLNVTPEALKVISRLLVEREIPDYALRVFVTGGGCSGLQYGMAFEQNASDNDSVVQINDVRLLVDPTSLMYLKGATIDFVDSLVGGGFRIDNPNSGGGCGCGKSFKAKDEQDSGTFNDEGGCGTCASY